MEAVQAIMAIYAVMTSVGENLTRGVEHIGEQCQAPGGGCCGEGHSKGGEGYELRDGRNVYVDGDNNGTIVNGDVNIEQDNHTEINPSIEFSPEINIEHEHEEHHHHHGKHDGGDDSSHDKSHGRKAPHEQQHNGANEHGTRPRKQHGGNHDSGNDGNHHRHKGGSSHDGVGHRPRRPRRPHRPR